MGILDQLTRFLFEKVPVTNIEICQITLGFNLSVKLLHVISVTIRVVTIIKGKQATDS